jgi:cell division topological specificity factor
MGFLERLFGRSPAPASGHVAKERLKLVLEYDRAQLTPAELDSIRRDIIASIARHVAVSPEDVQVSLEEGGRLVLVAEIPLGRAAASAAPGSAGR